MVFRNTGEPADSQTQGTVGFMDKSPCGAVAAVGPVNSAKAGGDFSTDKHE